MGWIIALLVLAAVLPIAGFGRLLWRSHAALDRAEALVRERGHASGTYDDFRAAHEDIREGPRRAHRDALVDIVLVGAGLVAGAVGGIWALFV